MNYANLLAAAWNLTRYKLFAGRRIFVTLAVFGCPVLLCAFVLFVARNELPSGRVGEMYTTAVQTLYVMVLLPFVAIYWGSALLSDEIENKTLVYLWTRPAGRARLFSLQSLLACGCLFGLLVPSVLVVYVLAYVRAGWAFMVRDCQMVVWDVSALTLGGLAYIALGYFSASLLRKPLAAALMYVFTIDALCQFLPGYLKNLSIRHYVYTLSSRPLTARPSGVFAFLGESTTTGTQAVVTLICVTAVLLAAGSYLLRLREFAGDDPARAQ